MTEFYEGMRVKLLPFAETNQPEQHGELIGIDNGCATVLLDVEYIGEFPDDGLREVPEDQVVPE